MLPLEVSGASSGGRAERSEVAAGDTSDLSWMETQVADGSTRKDSTRRASKSSPSSIPECIPVASLSVVAKCPRLEFQQREVVSVSPENRISRHPVVLSLFQKRYTQVRCSVMLDQVLSGS